MIIDESWRGYRGFVALLEANLGDAGLAGGAFRVIARTNQGRRWSPIARKEDGKSPTRMQPKPLVCKDLAEERVSQ